MVLSVIEEINCSIMIYESKKWLTFVIRWVDDIWFALVCFIRTDLTETFKTKCIKSALLTGEERFDMFRMAYKCEGLCIKEEHPDVFAGIVVSWDDGNFKLKQRFPASPGLDRKYQCGWSFNPTSRKLGLVVCLFTGVLDRCSHQSLIFGNCLELICCLIGSGFSSQIFRAAFERLRRSHPKFVDIFNKLAVVTTGYIFGNQLLK